MNPWLLFILIFLLANFIIEFVLGLLNLFALSPTLPHEFADTLDREEYARSQAYTKTTTIFSLIENGVSLLVTLLFLLLGGFNAADLFARSFGMGTIATGLCFMGILFLLSFLLGLPFSIYKTFVIEERFGFNRTTVATFITDIIKSMILGALIGGPLLALILWFFEFSGPLAWVYCWGGVVVISIVLQFVAPVLIMPLFNTFTPLEEGPLREKILAYAQSEKFTIQGIYTMDGSKRSSKLNAFFTGFGRYKKIVFFDTLIEKLSEDELIAVLAHEMGHFKLKHIWKMMSGVIIQTGIMFYLLSLFLNNAGLFDAFGMEHISIYASLIFFSFLYAPMSLLISVVFNYFSRRHEYEADAYAAQGSVSASSLIHGLKILSQANLSNLTPHPLHVFFHYTHPPVLARITALRKHPSS